MPAWLRTAAWFGLVFLAVSAAYWLLVDPAWLAGRDASPAHASVRAQALYVLVVWLAFAALGYALARAEARPLHRLRKELEGLDPGNVLHRLAPHAPAPELDGVIDAVNDLLARVHIALGQLDRFAAQVAHELRVPLTLARLRLDQAATELPEGAAEEVAAELERLSRFVDRTLLLAKAEQGNLPLRRVRLDLAALVAPIAEGIGRLAESEGRTLSLDLGPAWIDFDADYAKQIVYNLLANALRHGSGDICVRLRAGRGLVRFSVVNAVRAVPARDGSLGSGQRIVAALAALHRGMRVRYRVLGGHYVAQVWATSAADL